MTHDRAAWRKGQHEPQHITIHSSPGALGYQGGIPVPTRQAVRLGDDTEYIVWTDGSFRLRSGHIRRPAVLSGRQRVHGRKQLRRMLVAEQRRTTPSRD